MPNFNSRPDKWHLFIPMLSFYAIYIVIFVWILIESFVINKKYLDIIIMIISNILFIVLNDQTEFSQDVGYIGLIVMNIIHITLCLIENKKHAIKNNWGEL